jgi:hypothetical protein
MKIDDDNVLLQAEYIWWSAAAAWLSKAFQPPLT